MAKRLFVVLFVFALIAAACSSDDDGSDTTAAATDETTTTAAATDETTTTAAPMVDLSGTSVTVFSSEDGVDEATATLPTGWAERLVPIRNENTAGATGWCLEIHDLAISKLVAGREKDLAFLRVLLRERMAAAPVLRERLSTLTVSPDRMQALQERLLALEDKATMLGRLGGRYLSILLADGAVLPEPFAGRATIDDDGYWRLPLADWRGLESVLAALRNAGCDLVDLRLSEPDLETAFVRLLRGQA